MNSKTEKLFKQFIDGGDTIKKTRHRWADIYTDGRYYAHQNDDGTFRQVCISGNSHFFSGPSFETPEACIQNAKEGMRKFMAEKVVFC